MNASEPNRDELTLRADEIFFAAMELESEAARAEFVQQACADDAPLRARVARLLAALDASESLFAADAPSRIPAADVTESLFGLSGLLEDDDGEDEEMPDAIGPYHLLEKIGEGGAGIIYLAEQRSPVRRQVALKILRRGMEPRGVMERFAMERQALAMMEHPNIAHVYDAGETESGRPYFVMEMVRGIPITRYCDEARLDIRARMELFVQVCRAIQHAHNKGIVHRDIKPSNILISMHDKVASPVVIDFGIAKAVSGELPEARTDGRPVEPLIGTPAYMSPEQAQAGTVDVDSRSDVYSLGVVFYELLAGAVPFDRKELLAGGVAQLGRLLREQEPQPPSERFRSLPDAARNLAAVSRQISAKRLLRLLHGDPDRVALKALEKDRERRYETAEALAADIVRCLKHEPVSAGPSTRRYRFGKMVRRNRVVVASVAAISLSLVTGLATSLRLYVQAEQARAAETRLRVEAEARERITQAAVLLNRDRFADAEALLEDCELPVIKPSLEAGDVFRRLADWRIGQSEWHRAAEHSLRFVRAVQVDPSDLTDDATRGLLGVAPTLVAAGELDSYRRFIHETMSHFASTRNPIAAEHVVKMSLLLPADDALIDRLAPYAELLRGAIAEGPIESEWESYMNSWRIWALALYEYRRGNAAEAAKWCRMNLSGPEKMPSRVALDHIVLAMSLRMIGLEDEARTEHASARRMVDDVFPDGLSRMCDYGNETTGYRYDWITAYLLFQELEALLSP